MKEIREVEKVLKALANARRLALLIDLKKSKRASVGDLADRIHLSMKATSKHLHVLSGAGIVEYEQVSLNVYYRLAVPLHPLVRTALTIL